MSYPTPLQLISMKLWRLTVIIKTYSRNVDNGNDLGYKPGQPSLISKVKMSICFDKINLTVEYLHTYKRLVMTILSARTLENVCKGWSCQVGPLRFCLSSQSIWSARYNRMALLVRCKHSLITCYHLGFIFILNNFHSH